MVSKTIVEYLILCMALIWETFSDYITIAVNKKPDNHQADLIPRFGLCVLSAFLVWIFYGVPLLPGLIYPVFIFAALFDPIMGLLLHGNPLYKSPDSKWDRLILNTTPPHGEVFARLWILAVGIACYYHWDLVVGKHG